MLPDRKHQDVVRLLFPLELEGDHLPDVVLEGKHLDQVDARGESLLLEMRPDTTTELLPDWERNHGLDPGDDEPIQARREKVVQKIRKKGGLSIPYFLGLAEAENYEIEIIEPVAFMAGWGCAGDELLDETIHNWWGVIISNQPVYEFRAGDSAAGELLLWWRSFDELEAMFKDLTPAHNQVYFSYV